MFVESQIKSSSQKGSIEVICGSMFSGKTEELLRRLKRAEFAKLKIISFKPKVDVRYGSKKIVSHDKKSIESVSIESPSEMLRLGKGFDVIAIDEAQFFDISLVEVCSQLANNGIRIIIAGLDMDFLGNPFGPIPNLLAVAEHVTKVHAICVNCGDMANYSHRKSSEKNLVKIGEKKDYTPLCRCCFIEKEL